MANDLIARQLALQVKQSVQNLDHTGVSGLGTAAVKNVGTSAGQIPLTDSGGKILIDVIPDALVSGQLYKGIWDASSGVYPTAIAVGDLYIISPGGVVGEEVYNKNDQIIWNGTSFDHIDNAQLVTFAEDIKRVGFVDRTSTESPYLSGDEMDVVNLDDSGAGWSYYKAGEKYTIYGNKTIALTGGEGNSHDDGIYWITLNNGNGNLAISQSMPSMNDNVFVAYVYWNSSLASGCRSLIADERHTILWDSGVHESLHITVGAQITSDVELSDYQLDSLLDANKQFSLSSTNIRDEDINLDVAEVVGGNGVYTNFYRTAPNVWGWKCESDFPFRYSSNGRLMYDTSDGGAECSDGKFINTFVTVSNLSGNARYLSFTSQHEYNTLSEAIEEHCLDLDITGFFYNECVLVYKLTWQTDDTFIPSTGKCKLVNVRHVMENYLALKSLYKVTTTDIESALDRRYVTDAQLAVITNTSGENSGDETSGTIATALGYTPVASNDAITGASKTKITYDVKGLVTVGEDATTNDIADSTDKRYVTDAQRTAITHANRSNLDTINQDLGTTSNVVFNNINNTGYPIISIGTVALASTTVNNLVIPDTEVVKITSAPGNFSISGIDGGVAGRRVIIYNASLQKMSIADNSGSSSVENRILTMSGTIGGIGQSNVTMIYDGTQNKWIVVSSLT